jgi:molybdopterin-guanine dinucleotide biosynthesis protein A
MLPPLPPRDSLPAMPAPPPRGAESAPLGVILAGGAARRLGGEKMTLVLGGRPLLHHPLAALRAVLGEVVVVARADSRLPDLDGAPLWLEPPGPRHPLAAVAWALGRGQRDVLVCAGDMPLVSPALVAWLAAGADPRAPATVPRHGGGAEPLLAVYRPAAEVRLRAGAAAGASARAAVAGLRPRWLAAADPEPFLSINRPADLERARAALERR